MPTIVHFDVAADVPERARAFYESLFGWQMFSPQVWEIFICSRRLISRDSRVSVVVWDRVVSRHSGGADKRVMACSWDCDSCQSLRP